jgi:hypothetical protein
MRCHVPAYVNILFSTLDIESHKWEISRRLQKAVNPENRSGNEPNSMCEAIWHRGNTGMIDQHIGIAVIL